MSIRQDGHALGNVKFMRFEDRNIIRIYPYLLKVKPELTDQQKYERSYQLDIKRNILHETSEHKKAINNWNRLYKLFGYGLCNDWKYFITVTFNNRVIDRNDVDLLVKTTSKTFNNIKNRVDPGLQYCYIIEQHEDGAFHLHGLINCSDDCIDFDYKYEYKKDHFVRPRRSKFIQYGIKQKLFPYGLTTVSPVNSKYDVVNYVSKYITKGFVIRSKSKQSLFVSKGLNTFQIDYFYYSDKDQSIYTNDGCKVFDLNCLDDHQIKNINGVKYVDYLDSLLMEEN